MNEQQNDQITSIKKRISESVLLKIVTIGFIVLLLLIPQGMITSLIRERQYLNEGVKKEIMDKWGDEQTISGPVIKLPYTITIINEIDGKEEPTVYQHTMTILPDHLNMNSIITPELRHIGIYEAILYRTKIKIDGDFVFPDFEKSGINPDEVEWDKASIYLGISDVSGVQEQIELNWNSSKISMKPGAKIDGFLNSGVHTYFDISSVAEDRKANFSIDISVQGSKSLNFLPLGKKTNVNAESSWKSPSFCGQFIPDEHNENEEGFTANWQILDMNRNYPQYWNDDKYSPGQSSFGVELIQTVNEYQKNMRSIKYVLLIISLVFIVFFFFEIINKLRIHPIQYGLVGLSISIFYVLLISFSEHLGFDYAYAISAFSVITLILIYAKAFLKSSKYTMILTGVLILIYGFIYVILQLEDYALIAGSIGLFITLFITMYMSRNIDWYNLNKE